jgi:hypothetical protein
MKAWVLQCPKCKFEFEHSQINELGMSLLLLPDKPAFTEILPSALVVDTTQSTDAQICCIASRNSGLHNLLLETSVSRRTALDLMQVERDRRNALKVERDNLFAQYFAEPKNNQLALEIKAIDDEIAKSVEESSSINAVTGELDSVENHQPPDCRSQDKITRSCAHQSLVTLPSSIQT